MKIGPLTIRHYKSGCVVSHSDGVFGVCRDFSLTPKKRQRKALNACISKLIRHYGPYDFLERLRPRDKGGLDGTNRYK